MVGPSPQVREINRALLASIRSDFIFPAPCSTQTPNAAEEEAEKERAIFAKAQGLVQEVNVYKERYYGSSEDDAVADDWSESEEEDDEGVKSGDGQENLSAVRSRALSGTSEGATSDTKEEGDKAKSGRGIKASLWKRGSKTYRGVFSSPDSVAEEVLLKAQRKKRRKWRAVQEEMAWNEGLCFFERRRNAWTGAISSGSVDARGHLKPKEDAEIIQAAETTDTQDLAGVETAQNPDTTTTDQPESESSTLPPAHDSAFAPPSNPASITHIYIPIMHPLLASTNTVRSTILTRSLSELYDKIVRDSRTPAVPINLAHIMRVIVKGWMDEGNWPPKGNAAPEPMIASRRSRAVDGGGDVKKVLRRAGGKTGADAQRQEDEARGGLLANHRHLRQGVESMKKAFRLSGSGAPGD